MNNRLALLIGIALAACGQRSGTGPVADPADTGTRCATGAPCGEVCCALDQLCFEGQCCQPTCTGKRCGSDGCGGSCGDCDPGWTCNSTFACDCAPETDARLCQRLERPCGHLTATDNCGHAREVDCDLCTVPRRCDAAAQTCVCDAETEAALCARLGRACGPLLAADNCGAERTAQCGDCPAGNHCSAAGKCTCTPVSDAQFCAQQGRTCGTATGVDNCGLPRTVGRCGTCDADEVCTGAGRCLVCAQESDAEFCARVEAQCGPTAADDNCQIPRVAECGGCTAPESCDEVTNRCGMAANDTCANPTDIDLAAGLASLHLDSALASDSGDGSCRPSSGSDLVYRFTLAATKDVTITATPDPGPDVRPALYVRSACDQPGTEIGCAEADGIGPATLRLDSLAAGAYYLWVDGYGRTYGNGPLTLTLTASPPPPAPPNDLCVGAQALPIVSGSIRTTGTTLGAVSDSSGNCGWMPSGDVVYAIDVPLVSAVTVRVAPQSPAGFEPSFYVRGDCLPSAPELVCALYTGAAATATTRLSAGVYYLFVDSAGRRGDFSLQVDLTAVAANDTCAQPEPLVFDTTTHAATATGDTDTGFDDVGSGCHQYFTGKDLVYSYAIPPGPNQNVQIDVVPTAGSPLRPILSVRSACDRVDTERGCVDVLAAPGPASLRLRNQPPGTFFLWVDGALTGSNGPFTLSVALSDVPPGPPNDLCAGAATLPIDSQTGRGATSGTTVDAADDATGSCAAMTGGDVVFHFTLASAASFTAQVRRTSGGLGFVPAFYIRRDCLSGASADQLACATGDATTGVVQAALPALAAGDYDLVVDSTAGEGTFDVELATDTPVDNFSCAAVRALALDPLTRSVTVHSDNSFGADTIASTCNSSNTGSEVVFAYTVPSGEPQDVTVAVLPSPGSNLRANPSVRTYCTLPVTETACAVATANGAPLQLKLRAQAPGTYYLWIDAWSAASTGAFTLTVSLADRALAGNDTCATPESLAFDTSTHVALATGTTDAALDDGDPRCATGTRGDLVYAFTLEQAQRVEITVTPTTNPGLIPVLSVRTRCDASTEIGCLAGTSFGAATTLALPRLEQGDYYLFVDSASAAATGGFDLRVELTSAPGPVPNDLCAAATPLGWDTQNRATVVGDTSSATDDYRSGCSSSATLLAGPDLVYSFVLSSAVQVTARVTRDPSDTRFRPAVSLRSGCAGPGNSEEAACAVADASSGVATTTVSLAAGTWYVFVDGIASPTSGPERGPFTLEVTQGAAAIPGDGCGNALALAPDLNGSATASDTLTTATQSGDGSCRVGSGYDRVYRLELLQEKTVTVNLKPASGVYNFVPNFYLRRECDSPATETLCATGTSPGAAGVTQTINRLPAGTYYLWVDAYSPSNNARYQLTVDTAAPTTAAPVNDTCGTRQVLVLDPVNHAAHADGDTTWAVNDYAGTCAGASTPHSGADLVYEVTLPQAARLYAVVAKDGAEARAFYPALYLRSTCASDQPAAEIACSAAPSSTAASVVADLAAGTYYLVVDGQSATSGRFVLDVATRAGANANDTCASAEALVLDDDGHAAATGSTQGLANGLYGSCAGNNAPNAVYRLTTSATKDVVIDVTPGAMFTPAVYLRSACADAATQKGCEYRNTAGPIHLVASKLPAGDYWIVVDGYSFASGPYALSVTVADPPPPPTNDVCRGAPDLDFGGTADARVTESLASATDNYSASCAAAGAAFDGPDLVYSFSLASTQAVTATVTRASTTLGYDPAVYLRSVCESSSIADEIGCGRGAAGSASVTTTLPRGRYFVIVDGVGGTLGDFTLEVHQAAPVAGDGCLVAQPLVVNGSGVAALTGTTAGASNSGDGRCSPYSGPDLVYSFTTLQEQTVEIALEAAAGSAYIPYVYLRSTCGDPAASSEVICRATGVLGAPIHGKILRLPAGTYYLWVDSYSGTSGAFSGSVSFSEVPVAPAEDLCSGAQPLVFTGGVATATGETWFATDGGGGTCDLGGGPDLVYGLTLGGASAVTARVMRDASTPGFDPVIFVRAVCDSPADEDEVTCVKSNQGVALASINALPAGDYWIWIDGSLERAGATAGKFTLEVTLGSPRGGPANERCGDAPFIAVTPGTPLTVTGTTIGAQNDTWVRCAAEESQLAGDVVYALVTTADQKISATLTPASTFAGAVAVRRVCASAVAANELACAGDVLPGTVSTSTVKNAPAGTYWIWVDGATTNPSASSGSFSLEVRLDAPVLPPVNDTCARMTALSLGAAPIPGDTTEAAHDYGGGNWSAACSLGSRPNGPEVVYAYTPTSTGSFVVTMTPTLSSFDAALWYSTAVCGGDGSVCAGKMDAAGAGAAETLVISGVANATYFIYAGSYSSYSTGPFTIDVR